MNTKKRLYLFWKIGKYVLERQEFCENAIYKYARLCAYHYGMSQTFSRENVRVMTNFYISFPIFIPEMIKLEWEHYVELLKIADCKKRLFYFQTAIFCKSSVEELHQVITNCFYEEV